MGAGDKSSSASFSDAHSIRAWGLSAGAYLLDLGSDRITPVVASPLVLNVVFLIGVLAGPTALFSTTLIASHRWNRGFQAYERLRALLQAASSTYLLGGSVDTIPAADTNSSPSEWLLYHMLTDTDSLRMFDNLWGFENPFFVCATFGGVVAIVRPCLPTQLEFV